jgi:cytosine deaminase
MGAVLDRPDLERTRALGMKGKVTISHAFCLGTPDPAGRSADRAARRARHRDHDDGARRPPAPRGQEAARGRHPRLLRLDGIRDTWGPYGNADMLERAMFIGLRNNFRRDDELRLALDVCTTEGAKVMEIAGYGLAEGSTSPIS